MFKKILMSLVVLFSSSSFAVTWTEPGLVTEVQTILNGSGWYLRVDAAAPFVNPANCSQSSLAVYAADTSAHSSIILMAMASGKKIRVGVHETECQWDKPKIDRIKVN